MSYCKKKLTNIACFFSQCQRAESGVRCPLAVRKKNFVTAEKRRSTLVNIEYAYITHLGPKYELNMNLALPKVVIRFKSAFFTCALCVPSFYFFPYFIKSKIYL